jgi:hypothetical protein
VTWGKSLRIWASQLLLHAYLGAAYLAAGDADRARSIAAETLDEAIRRGESGHEAWAWRLSGAIAARAKPADREAAAVAYGRAVALAEARGMRPFLAQCHDEMARLYAGFDKGRAESHRIECERLHHAMEMVRGVGWP